MTQIRLNANVTLIIR